MGMFSVTLKPSRIRLPANKPAAQPPVRGREPHHVPVAGAKAGETNYSGIVMGDIFPYWRKPPFSS